MTQSKPLAYTVGTLVQVKRTNRLHMVVEAFDGLAQGKPDHYYKLDNGTHYWEYELVDLTPKAKEPHPVM